MKIRRKKTRRIYVGNVPIGGGAPIAVQSMTNTATADVAATLKQIEALAAAGCEIVRLAVPDRRAALALKAIKKASPLPLIADIHFDYRLALLSLKAGVDGLRINPGNIGGPAKVAEILAALKERPVPVRIGVNAGSLSRDVLHKYGGPTPEALAASAWDEIRLFADRDYHEIKISLKSFSVLDTVAAYRLFSRQADYPLHIGITEAGPFKRGAVRSAVGIGLLLAQGLGDTVRVSLTGDPVPEVGVAWEILRSLGLRERGLTLISCPTCARCRINLLPLVEEVETALAGVSAPLQVAVMGCEVNGPGEARQADVGVAGAGSGRGILFRKGKKIASFPAEQLVPRLLAEVQSLVDKKE